jgi:Ni/Fe-hydrogenase subunit HybB-like protein
MRMHITAPVIEPGHTFGTVTDKISAIVLRRQTPPGWFFGFSIAFLITMILLVTITHLVLTGIGIWGNNQPVGWSFDIINFVWWIGIGHAGTLISAILLLLRQTWRTSINRFAEAMTLFAVACAGLYPLLHTGRPWLAYWLFPYPNTMGIQPQFRSPLMWDVFAISTYGTVSALFWYTGLIPDFATLRDRARSRAFQVIYGMLSLGWRGSARHWHRYETAYLLLAGLSTPLVLSVHTIVSFDFAVSVIPGWHATIFPPYFVAGAIYAGFAMVLLLTIPLRKFYGLEDFITGRHLRNMSKIMLATGLIVAYGYMMETFIGWYSGNAYDQYLIFNRFQGPYKVYYWALLFCNVIAPQLLWSRRMRHNNVVIWVVSFIVSIGMWLERFIIIPVSLHRDFLPSSWGMYAPTFWDWSMFIGTIGLFFTLLLLFIRFLPMISIFEMRTILPQAELREEEG